MAQLLKTCEQCSKTFLASGSPFHINKQRFCSRDCTFQSFKLKEPFEEKTARVLQERSAPQANGCVLYTGQNNGIYGQIEYGRKTYLVHRVAFTLANGPIPDRALVCHSCDTPLCINPAHLWLGSHSDNTQDMLSKGRHRTNPRKRLSDADLISLRAEIDQHKQSVLAEKYGVSQSYISMLKSKSRRPT